MTTTRRGDYILLIDADEVVQCADGFDMPELTADSYMIEMHSGTSYISPSGSSAAICLGSMSAFCMSTSRARRRTTGALLPGFYGDAEP